MVIKTVNIIYFFSKLCSRSIFSNGADGYNLSVLWSIYYLKNFKQVCQGKTLSGVVKIINSGNADRACLEFLEAAAVVNFAVKSKAPPGLLKTFFAIFVIRWVLFYLGF